MAVEVILPDLGDDIEHAIVNIWHFKEGDRVNEGDDLVEIRVARSIVNIPSPVTGVVLEVLVEEGDMVEIGEALATIDEE